MSNQRASMDDSDSFDQYEGKYEEETGFERIRSNTGKAPNLKNDRRQQQKEWGKTINKHAKQRAKSGNRKP